MPFCWLLILESHTLQRPFLSRDTVWVSSTLRLSWPSLQFATPLPSSSQNSPKTLLYRNIKTAISKLKVNHVKIHRKVTVSWKCLPGNGFLWSSIGIYKLENKTFLSNLSGALPYLSTSLLSFKKKKKNDIRDKWSLQSLHLIYKSMTIFWDHIHNYIPVNEKTYM